MTDDFIRHISVETRYADETITCACGAVVTAPPDRVNHDRHEPLISAWNEHRLEGRAAQDDRRRTGQRRSGAWSL